MEEFKKLLCNLAAHYTKSYETCEFETKDFIIDGKIYTFCKFSKEFVSDNSITDKQPLNKLELIPINFYEE